MSHFVTLVAIPGSRVTTHCDLESIIDDIVRPYSVYAGPEYETFVDLTGETKENYEMEKMDCVRFPDGTVLPFYNQNVYPRFSIEKGEIREYVDGEYVTTEESKKLTLLSDEFIKNIYSFEEYCTEYCGLIEVSEDCWGIFKNENSQYDWYEIGGRWSCSLIGHRTYGNDQIVSQGKVILDREHAFLDCARMQDIDWEYMRKRQLEIFTADFHKFKRAYEENDVKALSVYYVLKEDGIKDLMENYLYKKGDTLEHFLAHIDVNAEFPIPCYSFIDINGYWNEVEDSQEVEDFLSSLSKYDLLAVVDCHI